MRAKSALSSDQIASYVTIKTIHHSYSNTAIWPIESHTWSESCSIDIRWIEFKRFHGMFPSHFNYSMINLYYVHIFVLTGWRIPRNDSFRRTHQLFIRTFLRRRDCQREFSNCLRAIVDMHGKSGNWTAVGTIIISVLINLNELFLFSTLKAFFSTYLLC